MRLYTDDYFVIGGQHVVDGKPCQDHTLSGTLGDAAYAVLSDGCSSGELTDIGARITTTAIRTAIRNHRNLSQNSVGASVAKEIDLQQRVILSGVRGTLGLSQQDMLATSMYAYISPEGGLVQVRGDGIVAFVYAGGAIRLHKFEWDGNAPLYPAYADDEFAQFRGWHGGSDAQALSEDTRLFADGEWTDVGGGTYGTEQGIAGITLRLSPTDMRELSYIALMSDGAAQVDNIDWTDAALRLVSFKNAEGAFVKRRLSRFLKEAHKVGDGPIDDISVAVIRIEHTEVKETDDV